MVVLKLAEETLSSDEAVVEDSPRGAQEFAISGSRRACTFLSALSSSRASGFG
jgi:hypothetical protein